MQALEKIGVLEQDEEKGGRRITQAGQRDLDRKYKKVSRHAIDLELTRNRYRTNHSRSR